jgi:hypothetical protein
VVGLNLYLKNGLAALDPIPMSKVGRLDTDAVNKSTVRGTKVTEKTLRRSDLKETVMAREKPVVRKTELCVLAAADHECVVLIESEIPSGLRARDDMQSYTHLLNYK